MAEGDDEDDAQKTEEPTQRRLEQAQEKGQVIYSKEVTTFLMVLVLAICIANLSPYLMNKTRVAITSFIEKPHDMLINEFTLGKIMRKVMLDIIQIILLPAVFITCVSILSSFLQNGAKLNISSEPLSLDLSKLSPIKGLKRIFSAKNLVEFIKSIVKLVIIGFICYYSVADRIKETRMLHDASMGALLSMSLLLVNKMLIGVCIMLAIIAIADYTFVRYEFYKQMRMSKHELKEEYKQTEGSPEIKAKIRKIRAERAKKRMMAAVPNADVIITNPTHFSVALKYEASKMRAPVVIAKGQDNIALIIREIAKKNDIPIVENPPLARALYSTVEIDGEIPQEHYKIVAEIISYVYKLSKKNVPIKG